MSAIAHIPSLLLERYALADAGIASGSLWALEAHLEACPACRDRLRHAVALHSPQATDLVERVHASLANELERSRQMPVQRLPRRRGRWAPPGLWARLGMTVIVIAVALGLDLAGGARVLPSLVLLVAPIAPLLGVTAVWTARQDPAHELVLTSPRAGLALVLRRTLAVLVVVIPALSVAGAVAGTSPAAWLLPCLAFTAGALALGEVVGLRWAATLLGLAWTAGVIAPSLVRGLTAQGLLTLQTPWLLRSASLPYWAGLAVLVGITLVVRRDSYAGVRSDRWFVR